MCNSRNKKYLINNPVIPEFKYCPHVLFLIQHLTTEDSYLWSLNYDQLQDAVDQTCLWTLNICIIFPLRKCKSHYKCAGNRTVDSPAHIVYLTTSCMHMIGWTTLVNICGKLVHVVMDHHILPIETTTARPCAFLYSLLLWSM